jgi:NAD(P)-dependent dehydrogenase (short-subunit alcohol dehydrogenase family)
MVLTNVLGPALLIRAALPELKETRGRIILVGSVAGIVYSPQHLDRPTSRFAAMSPSRGVMPFERTR